VTVIVTNKWKRMPTGVPLFCWGFDHPKFGKCGGSKDEDWSTSRELMEHRARLCEWPWFIIERVKE
jgi:hypothetical protein